MRRFSITICTFVIALLCLPLYAEQPVSPFEANILNYGAKGNGVFVNTTAINRAVEACAKHGKGTVIIPSGVFVSGTIRMQSNVSLYLQKGAVLKGVSDLNAYEANSPNRRWARAIIIAHDIANVSIYGEGTIDGDHLFDPEGEDNRRGPHAIFFAKVRNFSLSGITIARASNYAFMGSDIDCADFHNLTINEGWDGIHIRGGKRIIIRNSEFHTGDDCIAGANWSDMIVSDCVFNSSSGGFRILAAVENLTIRHCRFYGLGRYYNRTSKDKNVKMLTGIYLQPGGWFKSAGVIDRIHIHDVEFENVENPFIIALYEGYRAGTITMERVKAKQVNHSCASIESWNGGWFDQVILREMEMEYVGHPNASTKDDKQGKAPLIHTRQLPVWGLFVRNVKNLDMENVRLTYTGTDPRASLSFDNVEAARLENVKFTGSENAKNLIKKHSGAFSGNSSGTESSPAK